MRWIASVTGLGALAARLGVFTAALIGALVVLAPATLIDARLEQASDGRLRLAGAEGTVWSGTGWIEVRDANGGTGVAKRLAWHVRPGSLLRGHLVAEVELDQAAKPFPVTLSLTRLEIAGAALRVPVAVLGLGIPKLAPFRLTGEVLVTIPHLVVEHGRMDGNATLQWRAAGSALTPISPLGDYEVRFKAVGPVVHAALSTLEGPLQLDGNGTWSNGARPSFIATARVLPRHQEQLAPLFRLVAVERGAGTFELQLN